MATPSRSDGFSSCWALPAPGKAEHRARPARPLANVRRSQFMPRFRRLSCRPQMCRQYLPALLCSLACRPPLLANTFSAFDIGNEMRLWTATGPEAGDATPLESSHVATDRNMSAVLALCGSAFPPHCDPSAGFQISKLVILACHALPVSAGAQLRELPHARP